MGDTSCGVKGAVTDNDSSEELQPMRALCPVWSCVTSCVCFCDRQTKLVFYPMKDFLSSVSPPLPHPVTRQEVVYCEQRSDLMTLIHRGGGETVAGRTNRINRRKQMTDIRQAVHMPAHCSPLVINEWWVR